MERFPSIDLLEASLDSALREPGVFAERFYKRLFTNHPDLRGLFRAPLARQARHLERALRTIVESMRDPLLATSIVEGFVLAHVDYGVRENHYPLVVDCLAETLADTVQPWTPELACAWQEAFSRIVAIAVATLAEPTLQPSLGQPQGGIFATAQAYLDLARRWRACQRALSPAELRRWKGLRQHLELVLQSGSLHVGSTRRRFLRVPVRLRVSVADRTPARQGLITEISEAGAFVATDRPLPPASRLRLVVHRTDNDRVIELDAEVVWSRGERSASGPAGIGLRWLAVGEAEGRALDDIVSEALLVTISAQGYSAGRDGSSQ